MKKFISFVLAILIIIPVLSLSFSVLANEEDKFTIDVNGKLMSYSGNTANLVVPEKINGITVKAIGEDTFSIHDDNETTNYLRTVTLPDTCTRIENAAFFGCRYLTNVYANNIEFIGCDSFADCIALKLFNFSNVRFIDDTAFCNSGIESIVSDSIENISTDAFLDCNNLSEVRVKNLTELGFRAFGYTNKIDYVYAPKLAGTLGASIRLSDCGLRLGFTWDNTTDMQMKITNEIEYGFIYQYGETDNLTISNAKKKIAVKKVKKGDKTNFNLVFSDIPKANFDTKISARAYVLIDGIYFYSDILTRSFEGVATAVLNDPSVEQGIKNQLKRIMEA